MLLGLAEPAVAGWEQVRRAQVGELVQLIPVICLTNLFNAVVLVTTLQGAIPAWQLLAWLCAILMLVMLGMNMAHRARARIDELPRTMRRAIVCSTLLGIVWAVPPTFFSGTGTIEQQLAICLVSAGVIASAALTIASVPPAMLGFIVAGSIGLIAMMARSASPVLAVLPVVYAFCIALGGAAMGRALLVRAWAELALADKKEVLSLLLREDDEEDGAGWLWHTDAAKRLTHVSARLARATAIDEAALEGTPLFRLLAGDAWEKGGLSPVLRDLLERMNARQGFGDVELPVTLGGEQRWWRLSAAPRWDALGRFAGFRGVGTDITERRRSADKIDRMARIDALTGLANRLHFTETLRKMVLRGYREDGRCALLLIDLDKFKPVNDTLGHPVGDRLLKLVAQRLSRLVGGMDVCGRLGGDEFAIAIVDAADSDRIDALGEAIVASLSEPFAIDGNIVQIGASVGIAVGPRDGRTVEALFRHADLALYRAKDDGRGVHRRFESGMLVRAEQRRVIESALREAIDKDQLQLVYQPIVDAGDGGVVAFEALLRWRHPELGDIGPAEFVPIAEEARLLGRIGEWTLRQACAEAATWPRAIRLCLNLSFEQLHDAQLPATVMSALAHAGLSPDRLEFELSENVFLRDRPAAETTLDRLRAIGVRMALDDFGTGHAALGYVRAGRFATIKIDRETIRFACVGAPEAVAVVRATVALAETLGIITIAEGVETEAEVAAAYDLGCTNVQGFARGRPMPAMEVRARLAAADRRVA